MVFQHYLPTNLIFGRGRVAELGKLAKEYGKKALLVTGQGSTKKSGLLDRAMQYLEEVDIEVIVYDKVMPNPLTTTAIEGASVAIEKQFDMVIVICGGRIMDCAKAIEFIAVDDDDISDSIFHKKHSNKALSII